MPHGAASEVNNHICRAGQLIRPGALVIGPAIPRMIKPYLGPDLNGAAQPMTEHQSALGVFSRIACALPFLVIEEVTAKGYEVMSGKLFVDVVDYGPFWCEARR